MPFRVLARRLLPEGEIAQGIVVELEAFDKRLRNLEGVAWLTVVWALTFTAWAVLR